MSRVIKFRAWNGTVFVKDYYNHNHFISINGGKLIQVEHDDVCAEGIVYGKPSELCLQQFTGLHDKNGVEIYEGDVCVWYINDIERVGEIYYHSQSFEMRSPSLGYIGWDANRGEIEVIGNIHETPELLK